MLTLKSDDACAMLLEVEESRLQLRKNLLEQQKVLKNSLIELSALRPANNGDAMDMS
jgi:hypothetical protein